MIMFSSSDLGPRQHPSQIGPARVARGAEREAAVGALIGGHLLRKDVLRRAHQALEGVTPQRQHLRKAGAWEG